MHKPPRRTDIDLSETKSDTTMRRIKDWSVVVPVIGDIVNALLNEIIPDARMDRISGYLKYLEKRIDRIELQYSTQTLEGQDLFEEGLLQA